MYGISFPGLLCAEALAQYSANSTIFRQQLSKRISGGSTHYAVRELTYL